MCLSTAGRSLAPSSRHASRIPASPFTDTDLGRHMRNRAASLDHPAGSLLPELWSVLPPLARYTDILPVRPAFPPTTTWRNSQDLWIGVSRDLLITS